MSRTYGGDDTIHSTKFLHVETDPDGKVVAVWFRCIRLPFEQVEVDEERAGSMKHGPATVRLLAVELED